VNVAHERGRKRIHVPAMLTRKRRNKFSNTTGYDNGDDCNDKLLRTVALVVHLQDYTGPPPLSNTRSVTFSTVNLKFVFEMPHSLPFGSEYSSCVRPSISHRTSPLLHVVSYYYYHGNSNLDGEAWKTQLNQLRLIYRVLRSSEHS
jgi:hypothetical protein